MPPKKKRTIVEISDNATDVDTNVATEVPTEVPTEVSITEPKVKKPRTKKVKKGTRTPSSYVLFSMEYRKKVSEENPDLSLGEVSKKCGEAWKELDETIKNEWKEKALVLKNEKADKLEKPVDSDKPKRKPSNYLRFSMIYRKKILSEDSTLSLGEVSKRCGAAWKLMTAEEKEEWKNDQVKAGE